MDVEVEEEGDEVVERVLEEIGVDLNQAVRFPPICVQRFVDVVLTLASSSARLQQGCNQQLYRKAGLHRQWAAVVVVTLVMMISRHAWTV